MNTFSAQVETYVCPCFSIFLDNFYQMTTTMISQSMVCCSVVRCQLSSKLENFADLLLFTQTKCFVTVLMLLGMVGGKSVQMHSTTLPQAKCTIRGLLSLLTKDQ